MIKVFGAEVISILCNLIHAELSILQVKIS